MAVAEKISPNNPNETHEDWKIGFISKDEATAFLAAICTPKISRLLVDVQYPNEQEQAELLQGIRGLCQLELSLSEESDGSVLWLDEPTKCLVSAVAVAGCIGMADGILPENEKHTIQNVDDLIHATRMGDNLIYY